MKNETAGLSAIKATATWFAYESENSNQLQFWDEHSLNQQRFYNTLCWMYGSSPQEQSDLVDSGLLPEDRAVKCPAEYEKMAESWKVLLAPYMQETSSFPLFRD